MQLNKYLAHAGICSRRKAVQLITSGHIRVNGVQVCNPARRIARDDRVTHGSRVVSVQAYTYIVMNKPRGCVTTRSDERGRATIFDHIHHEPPLPRVYPVGRLDFNSTGLLVVTNDGTLAHRLQHPSYQVPKWYTVTLDKPLKERDKQALLYGVKLTEGRVVVDQLRHDTYHDRVIHLQLHSGCKRVIRRICYVRGYRVEKLDRPWYAGLAKKGLPRGRWRFLTADEIRLLYRYTEKKGNHGRSFGQSHRA